MNIPDEIQLRLNRISMMKEQEDRTLVEDKIKELEKEIKELKRILQQHNIL